MHRGWCYHPDEFLYFDPALAEFQQVLPYEDRREAYETLSIVTTPYGSLMLYLTKAMAWATGGGHLHPKSPGPCRRLHRHHPTGQTFAFGRRTPSSPCIPTTAASGTCYRIYLRGSADYLAYLAGRNPGLLGPPRPGHRRFPLLTRPQAKTAHGH